MTESIDSAELARRCSEYAEQLRQAGSSGNNEIREALQLAADHINILSNRLERVLRKNMRLAYQCDLNHEYYTAADDDRREMREQNRKLLDKLNKQKDEADGTTADELTHIFSQKTIAELLDGILPLLNKKNVERDKSDAHVLPPLQKITAEDLSFTINCTQTDWKEYF